MQLLPKMENGTGLRRVMRNCQIEKSVGSYRDELSMSYNTSTGLIPNPCMKTRRNDNLEQNNGPHKKSLLQLHTHYPLVQYLSN
jgi:hypothetical protein